MSSNNSYKVLKQFISSKDFGSGELSHTAYNTGWIARIRDPNNKNIPAFPKCIDWLRDNQLKDGSWGSGYTILVFERIVSTLIAIIALKEWDNPSDTARIERGITYLRHNLKHIEHLEKLQDQMTIGFELILPVLVDELKTMGIDLGEQHIIKVYREERQRKLNKILICERNGINFSVVKSWCFSLEGLGTLYSDQQIIEMVAENNLICCSFSATAFALFKGIKIDRSFNYISKVVSENNGGVPSLYKVEIFDLAWSLNSLIFVGFDMSDQMLKPFIKRLQNLWISSKGMVGACVGLPPDADDISNTIYALNSIGVIDGIKSLESLLKFFRKNYFITFEAEKHPSLSTNINCLIALKNFQHFPDIRDITYRVYEWTKTQITDSGFRFEDKWHYSSFYSMTRALLAFELLNKEISELIYQMLLDKQHLDGGWGSHKRSTHLETSYVIIAISFWLKTFHKLRDSEGIKALKKARVYMQGYNDEQIPLWIDKALYSPINVDKTSILASIYALHQTLKE